jgi:dCMP deaminase
MKSHFYSMENPVRGFLETRSFTPCLQTGMRSCGLKLTNAHEDTMNGWDRKFIEMAVLVSSWSKDPSTKVGCVIADSDHAQLSEGFNGFPRGIADDQRLNVREMKYRLIVHAEANAIAAAARNGHSLKGATAYVTFSPCPQCAALLIQAGIVRVVTIEGATPAHWLAECAIAQAMLREAGVAYEEAQRPA